MKGGLGGKLGACLLPGNESAIVIDALGGNEKRDLGELVLRLAGLQRPEFRSKVTGSWPFQSRRYGSKDFMEEHHGILPASKTFSSSQAEPEVCLEP
jgi:hypothetical protein